MIELSNMELFGFDVVLADNLVSINIMVDPQNFELKSYKKSPFASIIIEDKEAFEKIIELKFSNNLTNHAIYDIMSKYFRNHYFWQYNLYSDDEYEQYASKFENRRFHTMIYYFNQTLDLSQEAASLLITAVPLKGVVSPITKSYHYKLYNGCLIVCKPFKWQMHEFEDDPKFTKPEFYNKIVYILADVRSMFSFQEFIRTQNDQYGLMIDHSWYLLQNNDFDRRFVRTKMPYHNREDLFDKPTKNIFYLSDVPTEIMRKNDTLTVKM